MRNIDGPWRRPASESKFVSVQQKTVITNLIEGLDNGSEPEQSTINEPSLSDINDTRKIITETLESNLSVDTNNPDDNYCGETEGTQDQCDKNPEILFNKNTDSPDKNTHGDKRRDGSQLRFRSVRTHPEKLASEPENQIKIVTGVGKKKKTKHIVPGGKK